MLLRLDGKPFYIGKGGVDRHHAHEIEARSGCQCSKCQAIRDIWAQGRELEIHVVATLGSARDAYLMECELISQHHAILTNVNKSYRLSSGAYRLPASPLPAQGDELSVKEVAELAGAHRQTVRIAAMEGRLIVARRKGRRLEYVFRREDAERWAAAYRGEAQA